MTTPPPEPLPSPGRPDYHPYPFAEPEASRPGSAADPQTGYFPPPPRLAADPTNQSVVSAAPGGPVIFGGPAAATWTYDDEAPYGRDPLTGQPLSDKRRGTAALVQAFFGWIGGGRLYVGDQRGGFLAVALFMAALGFTITTFWGWALWIPLWLWWTVDFILILSGHVPDGQGRQLRVRADGDPRDLLRRSEWRPDRFDSEPPR
ncbi:MAG: hypothetical protein LBJ44_12295 [Propionibacteriaceae bacterium]|nr:hypothetical protein [Propionibacteriaceae bacterium]